MRVRFVTRDGCTICAEALGELRAAAKRRRVEIDIVDVDTDEALLLEYGARVPVILDEDGAVLAEGRISRKDAKAVMRAVQG